MGKASKEKQPGQSSHKDLPLPPRLRRKLEEFREQLWSVKMAEGALAGLAGLGLSYLVVFTTDRFFDTPLWLRIALLSAGFAVPALGLPFLWHRWVGRQRTLAEAARFLKRSHPRMGDELLGIIELAHDPADTDSRVLIEAAMHQVDEHAGNRDFSDAIPASRYGRWLGAAIGIVLLAGLLLYLVSEASLNALDRWVSPWKATERYTFAQLETVPDKLVVPYAESFTLSPELADSTEWRPDQARMNLPGGTKISAPRDNERYGFSVPPQKKEGSLSLRVGDARERIRVEPLPRPELTALEAIVRLPDYLRYRHDPVLTVRGASLAILTGSTATLRGTTSRELVEALSDGEQARIEGAVFSTDPIAIDAPLRRTFTWKDIHGLQAKSALELSISPIEDTAPDVFASQIGAKRIFLEDEVVSFEISAKDDFGIREIGLEWRGIGDAAATREVLGEKPVAAGDPEKTGVQARGTFSAKREGVTPQTLQVRAFATDFLPNRERTYSPTFILRVLNAQDHAKWLTEEFAKWFRNAREVYEREQQLHESNRALRELPAEELDRPESRRRLQEQVSAETGNARRLDALTKGGRDLVEEATKNTEFDAERLESWAAMMRVLEKIAREKMPSVADLLQQASRAPGAPPAQGQPGAESPGSGDSDPSPSEKDKTQDQKSPGAGASAPNVTSGDAGKPESPPSETPDGTADSPAAPAISDREKSLAGKETGETPEKKSPESQGDQPPAPLRLPQTVLDSPEDKSENGQSPEAGDWTTPAQTKLDEALKEQKELLAEFAKVADELQEILSNLEASTFVKRLKTASRKQTELASSLNDTLSSGFGVPKHRVEQQFREVAEETAREQTEQSRFVYHIQTDLEAYFQRKQDEIFKNVLEQMKSSSVVSGIKLIGQETLVNLNGRSIAAAEFWADTLDRWAEELVAAADSGSSQPQQGDAQSLPPEIVLKIMKALHEEMQLRDETREMEETRPVFAPDVYKSKVRPLEYTQTEIRERLDEVIADIEALPGAPSQFGKEIQLLSLVSDVMRQSHAVLARPDTGPEAIAAQTEAIELLLQSKRQQSGGGGGGGGSPGGGGSSGGGGSALSDIGPGGDASENVAPLSREVDQSTGKAGRELPEEFRRGLDTYFNKLESN